MVCGMLSLRKAIPLCSTRIQHDWLAHRQSGAHKCYDLPFVASAPLACLSRISATAWERGVVLARGERNFIPPLPPPPLPPASHSDPIDCTEGGGGFMDKEEWLDMYEEGTETRWDPV